MRHKLNWLREHPFLPLITVLGLSGLYMLYRINPELFHFVASGFSIVLASIVFSIAWNTRWRTGNHFLLVLGCGMLSFAALEAMHLCASVGREIFPTRSPAFAEQLRCAAQGAEAIAFLVAPLFLSRRTKPVSAAVATLALTALVFSLLFQGGFPECVTPEGGPTLFRLIAALVCALMLAGGAMQLHARRELHNRSSLFFFHTAILLAALQQLVLFLTPEAQPSLLVVSILQALSALALYSAVFDSGVRIPQQKLFSELERGRRLLTEAQQRYRSITDGAPVGIFRSTPEGLYIYANPRLAEIYGYDSSAELVHCTRDIREQIYFDPKDFHTLRAVLERKGTITAYEARIRRKDGTPVWTSRDMRVIRDLDGNPIFYDGFVSDISDRKRLETLQADMERIMRHDLKSPLISLISGLGMVRALTRPDHRGEVLLGEMERSTMQMLNLIDLSMRLNKMEAGDYEMDLEPLNLVALTRTVRDEHRMLISAKGLGLDILLDGSPASAEAKLEILCESALCHSLLANLVRNALEASPEEKRVTVELTTSPEPALRVLNHGEVPVEIREHFFEKYATKGKAEGTGLGTYSAKLIAETHGWSIAMHTGDGKTAIRVGFGAMAPEGASPPPRRPAAEIHDTDVSD